VTALPPDIPHSDSIVPPHCSKCGTSTRLFGIEPETAGLELLSFECPNCRHIETRQGRTD
jgi:hypothetical protein